MYNNNVRTVTMSSESLFDTLKYANKLKAAGVPEKQAETHAEAMAELVDNRLATKQDIKKLELSTKQDLKNLELSTKQDIKKLELSTKQDIKNLELSTKQDLKELELRIKELEQSTKRDLKELELRMTIKLGSITVSSMGIFIALMKLFKL